MTVSLEALESLVVTHAGFWPRPNTYSLASLVRLLHSLLEKKTAWKGHWFCIVLVALTVVVVACLTGAMKLAMTIASIAGKIGI